METLRDRLIHHGASLEMINGIWRIRLNKSFPYQSEVLGILKRLRQQVKVQQIQASFSHGPLPITKSDSDRICIFEANVPKKIQYS